MAQGRKAVKYGRIGIKLIVFLMALWISGRGSTITAGAFYEKENFENNKETSEEMEIGQAAHDMGISEELEQLQKYLDRSLGGKNGTVDLLFTDLMKAFASGNLGRWEQP